LSQTSAIAGVEVNSSKIALPSVGMRAMANLR
jgi:hypothetical protein